MKEESLKANIKEYESLKRYEKSLKRRLDYLSKAIKAGVVKHYAHGSSSLHFPDPDDQTITYTEVPGYTAKVMFRTSTKVKPSGTVDALIEKYGLWEECKKEIADPDLIEQAYLEGKLQDWQLRELKGESLTSMALAVEKEEKDV